MKNIFISFTAFILIFTFWSMKRYPQALNFIDGIYSYVGNHFLVALIHNPVTINELHTKYVYPRDKVKILIVPGHEPNYGGAEYKDLKERNMTVDLANYLNEFINQNDHYEAIMARSKTSWNPVLEDYFKNHWNEIGQFYKDSKEETLQLISSGKTSKTVPVIYHNKAPQDVATRLYGLNKWGNENDVDITIHIHFNDNPGHSTYSPGKYSGFAIYVPEPQYLNSTTTRAVAQAVYNRLAKYNATSDFPQESSGIIDEPDLIAIGAYNTADSASMLIEYSYIYETQLSDPIIRDKTIKDLAFQTYLGLEDFFGGDERAYAYDTLALPYKWNKDISNNEKNSEDVFSLQSALMLEGIYPPNGKSKNDCPRTGNVGPCTISSVNEFKRRYNTLNDKSLIGDKTKNILNKRFSIKRVI